MAAEARGGFPDAGGRIAVGVEEQCRLLAEAATDCVLFFLDPQGRVATWDAACERLFGYAGDDVVGQLGDLLFTAEDRVRGIPRQELAAAEAEGRAQDEWWQLRKDGGRLWVRATVTALRGEGGNLRGYARVCRDLTDQRRTQESLREGERRYRAVVENAWEGVTLIAADGTMIETTPATFRDLGYPPEEYVGRKAFDFLHPEDAPAVQALLAEVLRRPGGKVTALYRLRHRDGSWRWVESVGTNLLEEPNVRAVVVNHRDVTEQRAAAEALREADRRKDEFLAQLGHELRNPLAPIRNAVEVVQLRAGADADLRWAADVIDRQVRHLVRLVDDLLDVSRIRQGKVALHREKVELATVVAHAVETCGPLMEARRHQFDVTLASEPVWLEGDPTRLAQVLGNLLHNAAKYTPEGGHVRLTAERDGGSVAVRVKDDGIGIRPKMLPRVFDLFRQSEPALHHAQGGLGIGLTLVRSLIEMHGGSVEAFSEGPGKGSVFTVHLPALPETPHPAPAALAAKAAVPPRPARRVLVVDDNVDAAESLAMVLRLAGHEVQAVHEGSAVLEAARNFAPDVILLDIGLPGGPTGYELAPRLRELPGLDSVLLVALTGYGQEEDKRRAEEAGFDAHLIKPADLAELESLLAEGRPRG